MESIPYLLTHTGVQPLSSPKPVYKYNVIQHFITYNVQSTMVYYIHSNSTQPRHPPPMTKDKTSRCKYLVHLLKTQLLWDHKPDNNINMVVQDTIPHMCVFNTHETIIQFSYVFQNTFPISQNKFHFPLCFNKTNSVSLVVTKPNPSLLFYKNRFLPIRKP